MTVKIGTITTVVISSPNIAKEALQKKDRALASRFIPQSVQALSHDQSSVVFLPVLSKWNTLRKVCATKIFSTHQLDSTQSLRHRNMKQLLDYFARKLRKGSGVSQKFRSVISSVLAEASKPNVAYYYPLFRRLDPQGARRRMKRYYRTLLDVFDCIVEERIQRVDSVDGNIDSDPILCSQGPKHVWPVSGRKALSGCITWQMEASEGTLEREAERKVTVAGGALARRRMPSTQKTKLEIVKS
ncbi:hypothetical protein V8G54_009495 [Vigna mungo]|uniref:Uncharacterized protein n=1 Tax=Vigna mungo TaxID=3915 RepID=A0AAQ3NVW6_VIGMU